MSERTLCAKPSASLFQPISACSVPKIPLYGLDKVTPSPGSRERGGFFELAISALSACSAVKIFYSFRPKINATVRSIKLMLGDAITPLFSLTNGPVVLCRFNSPIKSMPNFFA